MRLLTLALILVCFPCRAKLVYQYPQVDGKKILYVKDGGLVKKGGGGIETGDAKRLSWELRRKRYDEVWLYSGGGNLHEGVLIGLQLRRFGSYVRVIKGDSCVSACTVAFMGGLFRKIDKGASYKVHSYSGVLNGFKNKDEIELKANPRKFLKAYANKQITRSGPMWGTALFEYFRLMVQPVPTAKSLSIFDTYEHRRLTNRIKQSVEFEFQDYLVTRLEKDLKRINTEGVAAGHDIAMRIERDAMAATLKQLKKLENQLSLGTRAKPAIRMLETMFESAILSTSSLSLETLREYGYTNVGKSK